MKNNKTKNNVIASVASHSSASRKRRWIAASGCALFALTVAANAHAAWLSPAELVQREAVARGETIELAQAATSQPRFFQITTQDVADAVAAEMKEQGYRQQVSATVNPTASTVLHNADHPLKLAIHGLKIDPEAKLWQAQAYILNGKGTELVKPVAGRFEAALTVPVLTRNFQRGDVIAATDIEMRTLPERQLRKDTITDRAALIGKSPLRSVSAQRPVRVAEISQPVAIRKGELVAMHYTTPYITISDRGEALEDGSIGSAIRIKNIKSAKAISARVVAAGKVEVNSDAAL